MLLFRWGSQHNALSLLSLIAIRTNYEVPNGILGATYPAAQSFWQGNTIIFSHYNTCGSLDAGDDAVSPDGPC